MSRILFFVSSMEGGGAERVAALLCNRWVAQGHDVVLVPTFSGRGRCIYPLDDRVKLIFLADCVPTTRKTLWSMGQRLWAMRRLVGSTRAQAVVSFLPQVNIATLVATRGLRVHVVVSERSYPPQMPLGPVWSRLRRITYRWASRVAMQTQGGREWLAREVPLARGIVIPNPCVFPLPEGKPYIDPETQFISTRRILLAVGRLGEEKQFDLLINAFKALAPRFPEWDLVILGDGPERNKLETQVTAAGLTARVHLPGRAGNVGDWYARADLYVMSSRYEGFPNAMLEALSYGLPAVSFDCTTGPSEIIKDGVNGFLVPPHTGANGLANSLALLMADRTLRSTFSASAKDVRERFDYDNIGNQWDHAIGLPSSVSSIGSFTPTQT